MKRLIVLCLISFPVFATNQPDQEQGQAQGQAQQSNSNAESGDSSSTISISDSRQASSAATLYSAGCQTGASGQANGGGVSFIVEDAVCQALTVADAHSRALKACGEAFIQSNEDGFQVGKEIMHLDRPDLPTINEVAACKVYHQGRINHYLTLAGENVDKTEDYNVFAKRGAGIGIGSLGIGVFVYLLLLI